MRFFPLLILLICLVAGFPDHETLGQGRLKYLAEPMVTYEDELMSGEVKNVPVNDLLQELLKGRDAECMVTGKLEGGVSIRFNRETSQEIIRRIMNVKSYNYTLVVHGSDSNTAGVKVLSVYQGDAVVRFETRPGVSKIIVNSPPRTSSDSKKARNIAGTATTNENFKNPEDEIKEFLNDMLASGDISREEYETVMSTPTGP